MAELKSCRQLCPWNTLYGCKKPRNEPCILSNMPCESFEQESAKNAHCKTNADHIRSMTDEELAEWLEEIDNFNCDCCVHQMNCRYEHDTETVDYTEKYNCFEGRMDWLKQPYKEDT